MVSISDAFTDLQLTSDRTLQLQQCSRCITASSCWTSCSASAWTASYVTALSSLASCSSRLTGTFSLHSATTSEPFVGTRWTPMLCSLITTASAQMGFRSCWTLCTLATSTSMGENCFSSPIGLECRVMHGSRFGESGKLMQRCVMLLITLTITNCTN